MERHMQEKRVGLWFVGVGLSAVLSLTAAAGGDSIFGNPLRDAFLLPSIEDGVVSGLNPKSVKLLEFVIEDYKGRSLASGIRSITYVIFAGLGSGDSLELSVGGGQFRYKDLTEANYVMLLGDAFNESSAAIISSLWVRTDGAQKRIVLKLTWDGSDWKRLESRETAFRSQVEEIRQEGAAPKK